MGLAAKIRSVALQTIAPHKVPHPDPLPTTGEGIKKERELDGRAIGLREEAFGYWDCFGEDVAPAIVFYLRCEDCVVVGER